MKKKLTVLLCTLVLLASLVPALAAKPTTIHATTWLYDVYVDGQQAEFANVHGEYTYLFSYEGTVYMPANTAAQWLGCKLVVNQSTGTATFTGGDKSIIPGSNSALPGNQASYDRLDGYWKKGVDVPLLTDFTVTLDGKALVLSKPPFFVDGTLYLPLRDVGARMGKTVTWVPAPNVSYEAWEMISIDIPPTQAQIDEMQSYLNQGFALWRKAEALSQTLSATVTKLSAKQVTDKIGEIKAVIQSIGRLPAPSHHFLERFALHELNQAPFLYSDMDYVAQCLRSGIKTVKQFQRDGCLQSVFLPDRTPYRNLNEAQQALNVLAAGMKKS